MVSITLYKPPSLNLTLELPASWNELLPEEVLFVCKAILGQTPQNAFEIRIVVLRYIVELRCKRKKLHLPDGWVTKLDASQLATDVYPWLDFLFTENDLTNTPPFVKIPTDKTGRYEPHKANDFEKITCGEYEDCEILAGRFLEEPSGEILARIAAILFRPFKKELVPYMEYNFKTNSYEIYPAEAQAAKFLKLKPEQLYSIFVWYTGNRKLLPKIFPNVYAGAGSAIQDLYAFTNCIHAGAGVKNGTRNDIRAMKLFEFMYDMEQEAIKANEIEKEYERIKNSH